MTVAAVVPQVLLQNENTNGLTNVNSIATHGADLSTPWKGSFTSGQKTSAFMRICIPYCSQTAAVDLTIHVLIDGVCIYEDIIKSGQAQPGRKAYGETMITLSGPGSHTWAVQYQSGSSSVAYLLTSTTTMRGFIEIKEAA